MASRSSSQFDDPAAVRRPPQHERKPPYMLLLPLVYAPVLPLIRIGLRSNPVLRDRLFYGVLAGAFAHGAYLMHPFILACANWFTLPMVVTACLHLPYQSELYDVESK
ncbi:uncharacterized protein LOC120664277 isoform X1 [Panicum virgatum]|uniref:uncharacterized protein LOC120664277 isoform X1 n=1 Tax=Panicum virgatum TaxID=38727 RepID=UPI0019D5163D|nr:uncharacterized protein LOC120664277 isoform X1 [Panicum virgatum]